MNKEVKPIIIIYAKKFFSFKLCLRNARCQSFANKYGLQIFMSGSSSICWERL